MPSRSKWVWRRGRTLGSAGRWGDDLDWATGDGPQLHGSLRILLLAMAGRVPVLDDLQGDDGVARLRARS